NLAEFVELNEVIGPRTNGMIYSSFQANFFFRFSSQCADSATGSREDSGEGHLLQCASPGFVCLHKDSYFNLSTSTFSFLNDTANKRKTNAAMPAGISQIIL